MDSASSIVTTTDFSVAGYLGMLLVPVLIFRVLIFAFVYWSEKTATPGRRVLISVLCAVLGLTGLLVWVLVRTMGRGKDTAGAAGAGHDYARETAHV